MIASCDYVSLTKPFDFNGAFFVYGAHLPHLEKKFRSWLKEEDNRFLIFLEDDEACFLEMKERSFFKDPKVRLYYYSEEDPELYKQMALEFLLLPFSYAASPLYQEKKKEKMTHLFSQLQYYHQGVDLVAGDIQDMGVKVLSHLYKNQTFFPKSRLGLSLKNKFSKIPVVIIGAGPSLEKNLDELMKLKDRALIIAGGSAVSVLSRYGIRPDFCVHLDPEPPRSRFLLQDVPEVPHFYRPRFSSSLLPLIHAPLLWVPGGGNYPLEGWLQEAYGLSRDGFDGGWTASTFATALACHFGCDPIIGLGIEFSHQNKGIYAGGLSSEEHTDAWVAVKNKSGKTVYSKTDWMMSVDWMSTFAKTHPEVRFINATEEGMSIEGMEELSFQEVCQQFLGVQRDLQGLIHAVLSDAAPFPGTQERVAQVSLELKQSFHTAKACALELLSLWEEHYPKSPLEIGQYRLIETDLEQEIAYLYVLDPLWQIWKQPILRSHLDPIGRDLHKILFFIRVIEENAVWLS